MDKRSKRYDDEEKKVVSRVNKNKMLYDDINGNISMLDIPTYEAPSEIDITNLDINNLKRGEYQKIKDYKEFIDDKKEKEEIKEEKEEKKKKDYDINKVLEDAKKNREKDELEGKRNIKNEDNILKNLNKKYLYQNGFSEEDNEELKELIDTITSKTMVNDIKDEEEKELLSELLATTIDIKLEQELSDTQIDELIDVKLNDEEETVDTNSFYSRSLELTAGDLLTEEEEKEEPIKDKEEEVDEEQEGNGAKVIFISLILLIIIVTVIYFILKVLKVI